MHCVNFYRVKNLQVFIFLLLIEVVRPLTVSCFLWVFQWVGQSATGGGSQGGSCNSLKTPPSPWSTQRPTQAHAHLHSHALAPIDTHARTHTRQSPHTQMHSYTHPQTHMHAHTQTQWKEERFKTGHGWLVEKIWGILTWGRALTRLHSLVQTGSCLHGDQQYYWEQRYHYWSQVIYLLPHVGEARSTWGPCWSQTCC